MKGEKKRTREWENEEEQEQRARILRRIGKTEEQEKRGKTKDNPRTVNKEMEI